MFLSTKKNRFFRQSKKTPVCMQIGVFLTENPLYFYV